MGFVSFFKILKYGFILCVLSPFTAESVDDEVDVPLLNNQNAPLFATLDLSKANTRVKQYVSEVVKTKMEAIKENVKDFICENIKYEIRKIVEEILQEKGYKNFTAAINDKILHVKDQQKQMSSKLISLENIIDTTVEETRYDNFTATITDKILYVQDQQKQMSSKLIILENIIDTTVEGTRKPKECADINFIKDGVFVIYPTGENEPKHAYCILQDKTKWTVIQRRFDFSVNFTRSWNEYKEGFGSATGDHWLGNEYINAISANGQHKVKFTLWKDETTKYAEYSSFRVEDEQSKYKLKVSGYNGTAGDSLINVRSERIANEQNFSTYDQDNDGSKGFNCAMSSKGGWWYNSCFYASLNNMDNNRINWYKDMGFNINKSMVMVTKK